MPNYVSNKYVREQIATNPGFRHLADRARLSRQLLEHAAVLADIAEDVLRLAEGSLRWAIPAEKRLRDAARDVMDARCALENLARCAGPTLEEVRAAAKEVA